MAKKKVGLSVELAAIDKITQPVRLINKQITRSLRPLRQFRQGVTAISRESGFAKVARNAKKARLAIGGVSTAIGKVARRGATIAAAGGIGGFFLAKQFVDSAAKFETTRVAFETMFRSVDKGREALRKLNKFSLVTPFEPTEVFKAGQIMKGFLTDITGENLVKTLTNVGDVAAITNQPLSEMVQIFGQVQAAGKLTGERLNQLQERSVPIVDALAQVLGKPKEAIRELVSQSKVSAAAVARAFQVMTAEGGIFANGMDKLSRTTAGKISTMIGFFDEIKRVIGQEFKPVTDKVIGGMIALLKEGIKWVKANQDRIRSWVDELRKSLPTIRQVKNFLKDLARQSRQLWEDLKPVRDIVTALIDRFGAVKVVTAAFALAIGAPMITAIATMITSMLSLTFSIGGLILKIPAALTALSLLRIKIMSGMVPALAKFIFMLKGVGAAWLVALGPIALVVAKLALVGAAMFAAWRLGWKLGQLIRDQFPDFFKSFEAAMTRFFIDPIQFGKDLLGGFVAILKNSLTLITKLVKKIPGMKQAMLGLKSVASLVGLGGEDKGESSGNAPLPSDRTAAQQLEAQRQSVSVQTRSRLDINLTGATEGVRVASESDRNTDINLNRGILQMGF